MPTLDIRDLTVNYAVKGGTLQALAPVNLQMRDGDFVVCERRPTARDGETVVALLEDGSATLKRLYRDKGRIRLQPANAAMAPIVVDRVDVQGVVVAVHRRL